MAEDGDIWLSVAPATSQGLDSFEISEVRVDALFQSSQSLLSDSFLTPNHLQSFE